MYILTVSNTVLTVWDVTPITLVIATIDIDLDQV